MNLKQIPLAGFSFKRFFMKAKFQSTPVPESNIYK